MCIRDRAHVGRIGPHFPGGLQRDAAESGGDAAAWRGEGHAYVGQRVARSFARAGLVAGRITKWLPADEASGDGALVRSSP